MNTPFQGVAPALQAHIHLVSSHRYPVVASLNLSDVFRYLQDAPTIVKQHAPMSWTYTQTPHDGTVCLEWLPLDKQDVFPSDGYVWADPEQVHQQNLGGFTLEMRGHTMGYRPGQEQTFMHARTRYHLVAKDPNTNAPMPDPALWIVHYHAIDRMRQSPVTQMPVTQMMQQTMAQRRWLESQGQLDRREFMLHDREHWPMLNLPNAARAQQPGAYPSNARPQQRDWPQPGATGPPAKRARTQTGSVAVPGASEAVHDTSIEDEENTTLGDFFDNLSQRDISLARYVQHHRWIEEVFSSPYGSHQIVPPDLGLGLMGELKGLTDGILSLPNFGVSDRVDNKPAKAKEAQPYAGLKKEQVDEFSKRVEKHLEECKAEIERMKAEHAAKMQDWKKVKTLTQAEKRLRYATWEGQEDYMPVFRLDAPAANGGAQEPVGKETVDDVLKDVEAALKVKITAHEDATRITRGGLKARKPPAYESMAGIDQQQLQQPPLPTAFSGPNNSAAQSTYHEDPIATAHSANIQRQPPHPSANMLQQQNYSTAQAAQHHQQQHMPPTYNDPNPPATEPLSPLPHMDLSDMMDMDVDESQLNFDSPAPAQTLPDPSVPQQQQQQTSQPAPAETSTLDNYLPDDSFTDLANLDGEADGLIDFDGGGGMGLDDSAFGDALHGMDAADGGS